MVCPAKDKANPRHKAINMTPLAARVPATAEKRHNYDFFLDLPDPPRDRMRHVEVKGSQFLLPLFEYSGACAGCGETPYLKLLTQLFGDRLLIANATGCSSIYGGNLPTTPYTVNADGRGPAWSQLAVRGQRRVRPGLPPERRQPAPARPAGLLAQLARSSATTWSRSCSRPTSRREAGIDAQRQRVAALRAKAGRHRRAARPGGWSCWPTTWSRRASGWSAATAGPTTSATAAWITSCRCGRNVNVLVLDTEVYSNTGGQASKSTPLGAAAKFAAAGKASHKKDLGLMAMSYGHVYVASVAFGAKDSHTVQAFQEAESYDGPSLIIAYSHCIAHGYDLRFGAEQQKLAVNSGVWPLYRYDPRRVAQGEPPLVIDVPPGKASGRRNTCATRPASAWSRRSTPSASASWRRRRRDHAARRIALYEQLAHIILPLHCRARRRLQLRHRPEP